MKLFLSFFLSILFYISLSAQCLVRDIPLYERGNLSSNIYNAKVINSTSIKKDGHIYTLFTLEINKEKDIIYFAKKGGVFDDFIEVVNPTITINTGDEGIFYLKKSKETYNKKPLYYPAIGVLSFLKYNTQNNSFSDYISTYDKNEIKQNYIPSEKNEFELLNSPVQILGKPVIYSIEPLIVTAGTRQKITIKGNNFGNSATGKSLIEFRNPDYATGTVIAYQSVVPSHILSWDNNKIEVIVPGKDPYLGKSGAGSGNIRLRNKSGKVTYSTRGITVLYNQFCNGINSTLLVDDNNFGGYTLTYNDDFYKNKQRVDAFERALESWQCKIHSSYVADGSTSTEFCSKNDGINLVALDTKCSLSPELLAQTTHWYIKCSEQNTILLEMDLIFDSSVKWHYDTTDTPNNKFDFESISLHELGHAHGMGHVLEKSNIMYANYFPKDKKRILDINSINCGIDIVERSGKFNNCTNIDSFIPYPDCSLPCNILVSAIQSSDCLEDNIVEYTITVVDTNGGGNGFNVFVDDSLLDISPIDYSSFGQTTLKVNIIADGLSHTLKVQDYHDNNCWDELVINTPNCECSLNVELNQISNCDEGYVTYKLQLFDNNGSSSGFNVFLDGELEENSPYNYSGTGSTFIDFDIIGDDKEHLVTVSDIIDTSCVVRTNIFVPDCNCSLSLSLEQIKDCNEEGNVSYLLNIFSKNKGNFGFDIFINDTLLMGSPFTYNLTDTTIVEIQIKGDGLTQNILVQDKHNDNCKISQNITVPNCVCDLGFSIDKKSNCDSIGNIGYSLIINNPSNASDSFNVFLDGILLDESPYIYNGTEITVLDILIKGDGNYHNIEIRDNKNSLCKVSEGFLIPDCNCDLNLDIFQSSTCLEESKVKYTLLVLNKNTSLEEFQIWIDNIITTGSPYSYVTGDTTKVDILLNGDGMSHKVLVKDIFNSSCEGELELETPTCGCQLLLNASQISSCDTNQNILWSLEIEDKNGSNEGFLVFVDAINQDPNEFSYTSPKTFINIDIPGDDNNHKIKIQDKSNLECYVESNIASPDCKCSMSLEVAIEKDCNDEGYVEIIGSIVQKNIISDSFLVFVDGIEFEDGPFKYINSEFSNFRFKMIGDGKSHLIEIKDIGQETCNSSTTILLPNCKETEENCELKFLSVEQKDCIDGEFEYILEFKGPKNPLNKYNIYQNGELNSSSPFNFHTTGVNTVSLMSKCDDTKITIEDINIEGCKIDTIVVPTFSSDHFFIYPNPIFYTDIDIFIRGVDKSDYDILLPVGIYNFLGKEVFTTHLLGGSIMKLSLKNNSLTSGVYYFVMGDNKKYKAKLIISK